MVDLRRRAVLAAPLALPFATTARAQADWPTRPIRLINPAPAGGPGDIVARPIAARLGEGLGQPVVVEARPGANGTIGANAVARAAPDGYTVLLAGIGPIGIGPNFQPVPYDPVRSFAPVTQLVSTPLLLVVRPDVSATTVAELLGLARARPGLISYGSVGPASITHLAAEMLALQGGVSLLHVPYSGAAPVVTDMLGGRIDMAFINPAAALPQMEAGRLRAIAVSTLRRWGKQPGLATVAETLPGFDVNSWYGLMVPAGTPAGIVERLYRESAAALRVPEIAATLNNAGFEVEGTSPAQYAAKIREELDRWAALARATGIRAE
jgi:tripartite-type tricarboxylate transporter receptor subunit TctC